MENDKLKSTKEKMNMHICTVLKQINRFRRDFHFFLFNYS